MAIIVAGSFILTPATAIRYERHDKKVRMMTREEELGLNKGSRRNVNLQEEYYVSVFPMRTRCMFGAAGKTVFRVFRFEHITQGGCVC